MVNGTMGPMSERMMEVGIIDNIVKFPCTFLLVLMTLVSPIAFALCSSIVIKSCVGLKSSCDFHFKLRYDFNGTCTTSYHACQLSALESPLPLPNFSPCHKHLTCTLRTHCYRRAYGALTGETTAA